MQRRDFLGIAAGTFAAALFEFDAVAASPVAATTDADDAAAFLKARRFVRTSAGEIAYVERGQGEAALFLHGFPLNGYQWRGALARLSPYRRCIAPDFLGLGYTRVAEGQSLAPDAQVRMLAELLDTLGVTRVDVVANDSGGQAAQLFLATYPDRVRTLLLTNCDSEIECPPPALQQVIALAKQDRFAQQWLAPWLADKALARSKDGLGGQTFTHASNPGDDAIDVYLGPLVRNASRTNAFAVALERNWLDGIGPALKASRAPTRIVWGTGDPIFTEAGATHLDRAFGASRGVRRVDGAKLFFPEEFPDLIADEARRLWGVG
ncbi:alpha/beta fold hydrolase [Lysobacter auxotrophicus]|uniref:Alpha/beta hydrolase n=1 Tax=Lysobacter auxotrophicus TaxID=2992573 RepID=A0ABM8DBA3_9GAMM|nr:alpha/beta hydrolase [Lysobacter auxotrophicus]BDU15846.1 alpha/beta hydrolase [Lysobacter auxotrophicus]